MRNHFVGVVALALSTLAQATPPPTQCCDSLSVDAAPVSRERGKPGLAVRLTNNGRDSVRFNVGDGPWLGRMKLFAFEMPTGRLLPNPMQPLVNPAPGTVELQPGSSEVQDIPLDDYYPGLAAEIRKGKKELLLFWTYQLTSVDGAQSRRHAGSIVFPPTARSGRCSQPKSAPDRRRLENLAKAEISRREGKDPSRARFEADWHDEECGWLVIAHLAPGAALGDRYILVSDEGSILYYAP